MTEIIGKKNWTPIRQLETHELAIAGPVGNMNEQARAIADRIEFLKQTTATKEELDSIPRGYFKSYETLAAANADIANIPLNVTVRVLSAEDGGDWYKQSINAITLTKSAYDSNAIVLEQSSETTRKYFNELEKNLDSIGKSFIDSNSRVAGDITIKAGNSNSVANYTYVFNKAMSVTTKIKSVVFHATQNCEMTLKVFKKTADKFIYLRTLQKIKSKTVGFNYIALLETENNIVLADEYLAISMATGNQITYELLSADTETIFYYNEASASATEVPLSNVGKRAKLQIGFYSEIRSNIYIENTAEILNQITVINSKVLLEQKIGAKTMPAAGSDAGSAQWIPNDPVTQNGILNDFTTYATKAGSIDICVYQKTADKAFTVKNLKTVSVVAGLNSFTGLNLEVSVGDYVGIRTLDTGLTQYIASRDSSQSFAVYSAALGATTGFSGPTSGYIWQYNLFIKQQNDRSYSTYEQSKLSQQLSKIKAQSGFTEQKIGAKNIPNYGTNAGSAQWIPNDPVTQNGILNEFKTYATKAGSIDICVYQKTADKAFTVKNLKTVSVVAGLNNFIGLNLEVSVGDYVGIRTLDIGLTQYISSADSSQSFAVYSAALGAITGFAGPTSGYIWQYNFLIENLINSNTQPKKWLNKKYVSFGDSITWYNGRSFVSSHLEFGQVAKGYQSYVVDELGCILDNKGESGWTMPEIFASRVNTYDFTDVYAVTLTSGANDHRKAVAVGTVQAIGSTFDTATYAGAMQASVEKIIASNKETKIFLITPIKGWFTESGTSNVPGPYNGEMMISIEYANAVKQIGALYSIPVVDWYNQVGINDLNKNFYLGDNPAVFTAYLLHPNQKGFKKMGDLLVSTLKNF